MLCDELGWKQAGPELPALEGSMIKRWPHFSIIIWDLWDSALIYYPEHNWLLSVLSSVIQQHTNKIQLCYVWKNIWKVKCVNVFTLLLWFCWLKKEEFIFILVSMFNFSVYELAEVMEMHLSELSPLDFFFYSGIQVGQRGNEANNDWIWNTWAAYGRWKHGGGTGSALEPAGPEAGL